MKIYRAMGLQDTTDGSDSKRLFSDIHGVSRAQPAGVNASPARGRATPARRGRRPGALLRLGHARAARRGRSKLIENAATRLAGGRLRLTGLGAGSWRAWGALRWPCW